MIPVAFPATAASPAVRPRRVVDEMTYNQLGPGDTAMARLNEANPIALAKSTIRRFDQDEDPSVI